MLNYIWLGLIALAVLMGGYHSVLGLPGNIGEVGDARSAAPRRPWNSRSA